MSLVSGDADGAANHAATALEITRKHFSHRGQLVGHRQLRLGVANFAQVTTQHGVVSFAGFFLKPDERPDAQ